MARQERSREVLGLSVESCGCTGPPALGAVTLLSPSVGWNRVKATGAGPCGSSGAGESSKTFHGLCSSQWPIP